MNPFAFKVTMERGGFTTAILFMPSVSPNSFCPLAVLFPVLLDFLLACFYSSLFFFCVASLRIFFVVTMGLT